MGSNNQISYYFQILGDLNRLKIISLIGTRELTVSEIVSKMQLSQPLISHHLRSLKESEILETKRNGPFIFYRLKNPKLLDVLGLFAEVLPRRDDQTNTGPTFMCPPFFKDFYN